MQTKKYASAISFTQHPQSVGENYFEHLLTSFGFAFKLFAAGFACLVHGLFPFLYVTTGSKTITKLHHHMVSHRDKRECTTSETL